MKNIYLNIDKAAVSKETVAAYEAQVKACMETLENGSGLGNDFLGWLTCRLLSLLNTWQT